MDFYKQLRNLNESIQLLEYNRKDLRNFAGDEYANKFFALRDRLQAPENDLGHWIKKGNVDEFKKFIDDWESGATKSKTQKKKEERIEGAELVFNSKGWKIYHITSYNAAKQLGSGTTWCITGRYRGYESKGQEFFNNYIRDYNLDGYYFIFDTLGKDPVTGDYLKYCAGIDKNNNLKWLYNGMQDSEISRKGIPNIPEERQIQPFADKGIELKYYQPYIIKDGVLTGVEDNEIYNSHAVTIPTNVKAIVKKLVDGNSRVNALTFQEPSQVEEIGMMAFANCEYLQNDIVIPDSVKKLGKGVFFGDSQVETIIFGNGITEIPASTCAYCSKLSTVVLPANVTYIEDTAFVECDPKLVIKYSNDCGKKYALEHGYEAEDYKTGEVTTPGKVW